MTVDDPSNLAEEVRVAEPTPIETVTCCKKLDSHPECDCQLRDDPLGDPSTDILDDIATQPVRQDVPAVNVRIVGIRFGYACKIYHFDAMDMDLAVGDWVVVKTEKGMGLGLVALGPFERLLDPAQLDGLRKVLRKATDEDYDQKGRCRNKEKEARDFCMERIDTLGLPMKLVTVECFFDCSKYVFYFTAEGRVDFRELVKQLVARFPVRIEMRQIGVRHEAKMTGGLACCGQELCCSRFLMDFRPVSVKMAKTQNLSLNPTKISGVCGRLMCCLAYEHDVYEEFKKGLPRVGKAVKTAKGEGIVLKHNLLAESICIRLADDTTIEVGKDEIIRDSKSSTVANEIEADDHPSGPNTEKEENGEFKSEYEW
jgi:cell fate regulator YaaT (PSP1 superfamily)